MKRTLGPGQKLRLQALADELGVSRSPVQHALTRLVTEGFVSVSRRGYFVKPLTARLMIDAHDVRLALELAAAEATVGRLSGAKLAEFRSRLDETVQMVDGGRFVDLHGYMRANKAFHEFQVALAQNELMSELYRRISVHLLMERLLAGSQSAGNSSEEHRRIVEAFEAGDVAAARAAIRANVETGKRLAVEAIERAGGVL